MRYKTEIGTKQIIECRYCKIKKTRVVVGYRKNGRAIFVDECGKKWAGKLCPECDTKRKNLLKKEKKNE